RPGCPGRLTRATAEARRPAHPEPDPLRAPRRAPSSRAPRSASETRSARRRRSCGEDPTSSRPPLLEFLPELPGAVDRRTLAEVVQLEAWTHLDHGLLVAELRSRLHRSA